MRWMMSGIFSTALALAGCTATRSVVVAEDQAPIEVVPAWPLRDIAPLGAACEAGPDGWPLATHLTRRDTRAYVAQQMVIVAGQAATAAAR